MQDMVLDRVSDISHHLDFLTGLIDAHVHGKGYYGRLDKDSYFPTTVTNMDPTAKQCKVLNPYVSYHLYPNTFIG
jgi:hypothetical protein